MAATSQKPYGIGLIGAGMIAGIHAKAIERETRTVLAGVMDNGSGRGAQIAPTADTRGHDDLDVFLNRDDIDLIVIATPSGTHSEIAIQAAAAGKHCLCEKPIGISLGRIDAMIEVFGEQNLKLGGVFNTRYSEGAQLLKAACEQGRFGDLHFAQAFGPWWRDQSYYDESQWKGTWALDGGGALMNQGIHSVDLLQWLVDQSVASISGYFATRAHPGIEVEDTACASLQFSNGTLATIACTTSLWPGHFRTITLGGSNGTAVLADGNLLKWQFRNEQPQDQQIRERLMALPEAGVGASSPSAGVDSDGHLAVLSEFVDAIEQNRQPLVDGTEARKSVEIILAIYESSRNAGRPVVLNSVG